MIYAPVAQSGPAKWGVVCTCFEPTQLVVAFVAHHVRLGASEVHIFLDQPQPDLEKLLSQVPQVQLVVCDDAYWSDTYGKARPKAIEPRQILNAHRAYQKTTLPWLAHIDADEFLHADMPVPDLLSALPDEVEYITFEPRERAFVEGQPQATLFDGVYRKPLPRRWEAAPYLFAKGRRFLRRGILGHAHGKSMMRTGRHLLPGIHSPRRPGGHRDLPLYALEIEGARLLHFDGITALHWSAKLLRAAEARNRKPNTTINKANLHREHQITRMRRIGANLENARALHDLLKTVSLDQIDRLRTLSLIEDYALSPKDDILALGLSDKVDLSRQGFDAALAAQQPQISQWLTEWETLLAEHPSAVSVS